jgi:hypothetical protein
MHEPAVTTEAAAGESSHGTFSPGAGRVTLDMFNELQVEVAELRAEVARLRSALEQSTDSSGQ